jgi:hypothetical protein
LPPYQKKLEGGCFLATHKSAIKRSKQNEEHRERNIAVKSRVKTAVKSVLKAVEAKDGKGRFSQENHVPQDFPPHPEDEYPRRLEFFKSPTS